MAVSAVCDAVLAVEQAQADFAVNGTPAAVVSAPMPADVATPAFYKDNLLKLNDTLSNRSKKGAPGASEGELIAQLEINAFMATFQNAAMGVTRTRVQRQAARFSNCLLNTKDYGPLLGQLRAIGVKVDNDFTGFIRT